MSAGRRSATRTTERAHAGAAAPPAERGPLDGGVLVAAGMLIGIGVVMSYSSTAALDMNRVLPPLFVQHVAALAIGLLGALAGARMPLRWWYRLAPVAWATGIGALVATDLFGDSVNGAQRWLSVPGTGFRFQPVEPVKLATVIAVVASVTSPEGRRGLSPRRMAIAASLVAIPIALLLRQPDLGNAVMLAALTGMILVAAGTPLRLLVAPALVAVAGIAAFVATHDYALRRVTGFLDPYQEAQGSGFQLVQSFAAFGGGGLFGLGLGNGRAKLLFLPEAHTDFILSLIGEELGLIGVLVVLGAFVALWLAGTRIARAAENRFGLLLAFAMTSLLTLPAVVNAAVVMGLLPTKGLTLPFLSYGGTSLVVSCTALGILLGVATRAPAQSGGRAAQPSAGAAWR